MTKTIILFDLDGTLIDTGEGITKSVAYALEKFGLKERDPKTLERFIGPPLADSFPREYGFSKEQTLQAVAWYRERYHEIGIWECRLYPEVKETLQRLGKRGLRLGVASSKPEEMCRKLLEHFEIAHYFEHICGATLDGRINTKVQVLEYAVKQMGIADRGEALLIGDTKFDAEGAKAAGIDCIGISYGYEQDLEAMRQAGAAVIFDTLGEAAAYAEERAYSEEK